MLRNSVFIIAEAGVNHNGSLKLAKKLIDAAAETGADAVKFQTFKTEKLVTLSTPQAGYQKKNAPAGSQYEMLKKLELSDEDFRGLFDYCAKRKIMFLSTPFDLESADFLCQLGMKYFKISSGDLTNLPMLSKIAAYKKPLLLSTGMSTLAEVGEAVKAVRSSGNKTMTIMHCTSNYPTRYEDVNLKALLTLQRAFRLPIGYSDHTPGVEVSIAAVALGAGVIEKHLTLDKKLSGPDHRASLEPAEFISLVESIRHIEKALGDGEKTPRKSEHETRRIARKSIVAAVDIKKGSRIAAAMLAVKRPGTGIEPKYLPRIIGKRSTENIKRDEMLDWGMMR